MKYVACYALYSTVLYTIDNPSRSSMIDCVGYDSHADEYVLTFVHGSKNGDLSVQIGDESVFFTPNTLRETLKGFGIDLDPNKRIVIFPCHPEQVIHKFAKELVDSRIIVQGDWNTLTGISSQKAAAGQVYIQVGKQIEETPQQGVLFFCPHLRTKFLQRASRYHVCTQVGTVFYSNAVGTEIDL